MRRILAENAKVSFLEMLGDTSHRINEAQRTNPSFQTM
jgi:hypothetical protein